MVREGGCEGFRASTGAAGIGLEVTMWVTAFEKNFSSRYKQQWVSNQLIKQRMQGKTYSSK